MTWLPSYVKLFLLFIGGFVLTIVGIVLEVSLSHSYTTSSIAVSLRLLGLIIMVVSPLLIALKFFAQLDRKAK